MIRRLLGSQPVDKEESQRENIFHTRCSVNGKICLVIIDGGSCTNVVSARLVSKMNMDTKPHPKPYKLQWLNEGDEVHVERQAEIPFSIGKYQDKVLCDVVPMEASHILLGRPWQFETKAIHDGFTNKISFNFQDKKVVLKPLSPKEVREDQKKLREKIKKEREIEKFESEENKKRREIFEGKQICLAREKEVKRVLCTRKTFCIWNCENQLIHANHFNYQELPLSINSLLQDFEVEFPAFDPNGIPPLKGVKDLVPRIMVEEKDVKILEQFLKTCWDKFGTKLLCSYHPQKEVQIEVMDRILGTLFRIILNKFWEECFPHEEFSYDRAIHSATNYFPFEIAYGFNQVIPLEFLSFPNNSMFAHNEQQAKVESVKKKQGSYAHQASKGKEIVIFHPGEWMWVHMQKKWPLEQKKSNFLSRKDGPFQVLERNKDNDYKIEIFGEYQFSTFFKVSNLSLFDVGKNTSDLRTNLFQEGGYDEDIKAVSRLGGPMTRAQSRRAKEALQLVIKEVQLQNKQSINGSPHFINCIQVEEEEPFDEETVAFNATAN